MNADCPHKCTRRPRPPYVADGYAQRPVIGLRKVFGIEETHPFQILSSFLFTLSNHLQKKRASISTLSSPPSHPPHTQWLPSPPPRTLPSRASPSTAASPSPALCAAVSPTALSLLWMCKSKAQAPSSRTTSEQSQLTMRASSSQRQDPYPARPCHLQPWHDRWLQAGHPK